MLNKPFARWILLVLLALASFGQAALAATHSVNSEAGLRTLFGAPPNYTGGTIANGDIVEITGDIVLTDYIRLPGTGIAYTINGNGYTISVAEPYLDEAGQQNPAPSQHGMFRIMNGQTPSVVVNDLTLIGGLSSSLPGARNADEKNSMFVVPQGASVQFNRVTFTRGGGSISTAPALDSEGTVRFSQCQFNRNVAAEFSPGAISLFGSGKVYIDRSSFTDNQAFRGGAIYAGPGSILVINNSTFSNNFAFEGGGAIYNAGGKTYALNSTFTGNATSASASGGAAYSAGGTLGLYNSLLAYNYANSSLNDVEGTTEYYYTLTHGTTAAGSGGACIDSYGSTCHADFGLGMCTDPFVAGMCEQYCGICTPGPAIAGVVKHVQYNGASNGSDDTLFAGGAVVRGIYQALLVASPGGTIAQLKKGSLLADAANAGTRTRFNAATDVAAYWDGSAWKALPYMTGGIGVDSDEVTRDQVGEARVIPARGASEAQAADLYILRVLAPTNGAANGSVSGGTVYGDSYVAGATVKLSAFPATGKVFAKWVDENGADVSTANPYTLTMPAANVTLQPVFNSLPAGQFSITYLGNGNTGGTAPATDGPNATAPKTLATAGSLVRTGFTFAGWNTRANGSGTAYAAGASYSTVANLTLYAQWTPELPTLTAVSPNQGALAGGNRITLTGTGLFRPLTITVGGNACTDVQSSDPGSATCLTPSHAAGAVDVSVTTPQGGPVTLSNGYTYDNVPQTATVTPNNGGLGGGTLITVSGNFFVAGFTTVSIGGNACTSVNVSSATSLTCITPAGAGTGAQTLSVTTPGGTVNGGTFTYTNAPALTSLSPDRGPVAGGTTLTLTGTGFGAGMTVTVGGSACALQSVTATQATCVTPAGIGTATVTVTTSGGSVNGSFIYDNVPTIKVVKPTQGPTAGGGTLQLTGTSFLPGATVTVGGNACTSVNVAGDTSLTCTLPAHAAGPVTVTVTTTGGSANGNYRYDDVPTLTSVAPDQGPTRGGTQITLTGTGFIPGMGVTVNGVACTSLVIKDQTEATCLTPTSAAGAMSVVVVTPGGTSGAQPFTYDNQPTITSKVYEAKTAGGSILVIDGTAFIPGHTTITIGGQACQITTSSTTNLPKITDTRVICSTPAGAAGTAPLVLTTPGGSVTATVTYVSAPTLSGITPGRGPLAGGTPITITGAGFSAGTSALMLLSPAVDCTSLQRISDAEMTCVTPPSTTAGVKNVFVANVGGSAPPLHFIYDDLPAVASISPNQGPLSGGNTITLTGSSFVAGSTSVSIGGAACTPVTVVSSSELNCKAPARGTAGSVPVTVTTTGGTSTGNVNYTYDDVPSVTGLSPDQGQQGGGTQITVSGSGFVPGSTTVTVGGTPCTSVVVIDTHTLTCLTGPGTGAGGVAVSTPGGGTVNAGVTFSYDPAPTLRDITPSAGPTAGGTRLRLLGTGFVSGATSILIASNPCTSVDTPSDSEAGCTAPAGSVGQQAVNLVTPGGVTFGAYTYTNAPTLASVTPAAGPVGGGTTLTLTGTGFVSGTTVTVGGAVCGALNIVSATSITCVTPAGSAGIQDVIVSNAGGSVTGAFTYDNAPSLKSVTPNQGPVAGGTLITLSGTGFIAGTTVTVGGAACGALTLVGQDKATCVTPPHAAGTVAVAVSNPGGSAKGNFTYDDLPTIATISPLTSPPAGGLTLTITGTGFVSGTTVTVGGTACGALNRVSETTLTCVLPARAAGPATVRVENAGGSASKTLTYADPVATVKTKLSGGVTATLTLSGCGSLSNVQLIPPPAGAPAGVTFPYEMIDFTADNCVSAPTPVTVTITYSKSIPAGNRQLYKAEGGVYRVWPASIGSNSVTYQVVDGGAGDGDSTANNRILDPAGVGLLSVTPSSATPIPTLSEWGMILLSLLLAGMTALRLRQV
jgi:uncharacterized repeat protein (TIGR02543 family)